MAQKLDPDVSRPDLRILNQECLYFPRIPSFICPDILPLICFDWVSIADADLEGSYLAGEELVVCKDNSVYPNIFLNRGQQQDIKLKRRNVPRVQ